MSIACPAQTMPYSLTSGRILLKPEPLLQVLDNYSVRSRQEKKGIYHPDRLYEFIATPFGIFNGTGTFDRLMGIVLRG